MEQNNTISPNLLIYEELNKIAVHFKDKTAIICQGKEINYNEFFVLVNNYAAILDEYKINAYDFVVIQMERCIQMVALMFALIKTGATFYLAKKDDVVRYESLVRALPPTLVITISSEKTLQINNYGISRKYPFLCETAYIFSTSGSTGNPKTILTSYESFINTIQTLPNAFHFNNEDCIGALSDVAFDVFLTETIIALCVGMKVVLFTELECKQLRLLMLLIKEQRVTVLQTVPSRLRMISYLDPELRQLDVVQKIYLGGEKVTQGLVRKLKEKISARVFHIYGTTEDSIWTCISEINEKMEIEIGCLIEGHCLELLNENGRNVAVGELGCIYLSGKGLFQGYLEELLINDEKPTANRKFCTGDYAITTKDNKIFILGRKDNMVKIQGHRIELEEIESVTKSIENIAEAVAKAYQNLNEDWIICLYYKSDTDIDESVIVNELKSKLPKSAIPKLFFHIEDFEYLPSGKINRNNPQFKSLYDEHKSSIVFNKEDAAKTVCSIIAELCGYRSDEIKTSDPISKYEITSIIFIKFIIECEKKFSIQFENEALDVELYSTIDDLLKYILMRVKNGNKR